MKISLFVGALLLIVASNNSFARGGHHPSFAEIDTNTDGLVSLQEFQALSEQRFRQIDSNQDGYIQKEEMQAAHTKRRERRK